MGTNVLTFVKNLVAFRLFPYKMSRLFNIRLYSIAYWLSWRKFHFMLSLKYLPQ